MRIGIYLDLRNPPEWQKPWPDFYRQSLELAVQAEKWGADSVWLSEHHFFEDGYLPQPLTFAAAVAARTQRVRIGTAVLLAPLRLAPQIAEEAAVADQISNGRIDLGLGAGYVFDEFEAYGADLSKRYTITDQRVREVRELLDGGVVTPPAVQNPFPIWLGYNGLQGARRAGRLGCGLLSINQASLEPYTEGLAEGGHDPSVARMAGVVSMVVADDPEKAYERILPHLAWQLNTYRAAGASGSGKTPSPLTVEKLRERRSTMGVISPMEVLTPDEAIEHLRSLSEGIPMVEAYCWASIAGMPDDLAHRHAELLCTVVREGAAEI
ncbi:LLM class flavin-dependent oxidoreductase [Candidatus Poriferisocius sp.]|uniref:LLM class flavin-dependent oxidoreductase n=1 Tax=Candidatus Poriferisocius sp. TaxID=3101276 RepID=UPI003B029422